MKRRTIMSLLLAFSVLCTSTVLFSGNVNAETGKKQLQKPMTITIKVIGQYYALTRNAALMSGATGNGYRIGTVSKGTVVEKISDQSFRDSQGNEWYHISYYGGTGYLCANCLLELGY